MKIVLAQNEEFKVRGANAASDTVVVDANGNPPPATLLKSPDGDTAVSADNDGTAKVTKTEHSLRDPVVTFANGYSINYYSATYTAPLRGETIEFVGPVPSASPSEPNATFYYPSTLGTLDSFAPEQYSVWCIWVNGSSMRLMYQTGPDYIIGSFDTENPTLTLNNGETTGNPPIMTREDRPYSTTKTVATTDQIPAIDTTLTQSGKAADAKATGDALEPLLFAQYYPDGSVKSAAEFTPGIKYDTPDTTNRTITVKPFCNVDGTAENDNSNLSGRVVIPPFVDAQGNGYISDDGTRFKVVGVGSGSDSNNSNENLTAVIAPSTVANIEDKAFHRCTKLTSVSAQAATSIGSGAFNTCSSLVSVSLPAAASIVSWAFVNCTSLKSISLSAATSIGDNAFRNCTSLKSVSLPAATSIKGNAFNSCYLLVSVSLPVAVNIKGSAFNGCYSLASVSLPAATSIEDYAFGGCTSLESIDFGATLSSVPTLGANAFNNVPKSCKIIVPDAQYDAWIAATNWSTLYANGYQFLKRSEWDYVRRYELNDEARTKKDVTQIADEFSESQRYDEGDVVMYQGVRYKCIIPVGRPGPFDPPCWTDETVQDAIESVRSTLNDIDAALHTINYGSSN